MDKFAIPIQVRWSDIDPNRHLRHSAYYDYGATVRVEAFSRHGLTNGRLEELKIGPILFREEAIFKREIRFEDLVTVDMVVTKATADYGRWSIQHHLFKQGDVLAAIINVDGAWIDMEKRKLAIPDSSIQKVFDDFPRAADFQLIVPEKKG